MQMVDDAVLQSVNLGVICNNKFKEDGWYGQPVCAHAIAVWKPNADF